MKLTNTVLTVMILLIICVTTAYATPIDTVEAYYQAFADEDFDAYLNTHMSLSEAEVTLKKAYVQEIWTNVDVASYTLYDFKEEITNEFAIVTYVAEFELIFPKEATSITDKQQYSALLINDDGWKIGVVGDALSVQKVLNELVFEAPEIIKIPQVKNSCRDGLCELNEVCVVDCKEIVYTCTDCQTAENVINLVVEDKPKQVSCEFDDSLLYADQKPIPDAAVSALPEWVSNKLLDDVKIDVIIDNTSHTLQIADKKITAKYLEKVDYEIITTSCVLSSLEKQDMTFQTAYKQKLITVSGQKVTTKLTQWLTSFSLTVWSWFNPPPKEFIIEAKSGVVSKGGQWSRIGVASSRGEEELYLGMVNSYATYTFESPFKNDVKLYAKVSDDGVHPDGSRSVKINVNGKEIIYDHVSTDYMSSGKIWDWVYVGDVTLQKENTMVITKHAQTSAAFVAQSFKFVK